MGVPHQFWQVLALLGLWTLIHCGPKPEVPTVVPQIKTQAVDESDQFFALEGDYAASHILIPYQDAENAPPTVTRSEAEAETKAREVLTQVQTQPDQFEALAHIYSEGISAVQGGRLGAWKKGEFLDEIEKALATLEEGQILDQPVKTEYGYHVLRRDPIVVKHYAASGLIIGFQGHPQNPPDLVRTKEEAKALADTLKPQLSAESFESLATEHNDLGKGAQYMGVMRPGDPLPEGLLAGLDKIAYGEVIGPFEFPMGYVFLKREKVVHCKGSTCILIAYQGAENAADTVTRSKETALEEVSRLIELLVKEPSRFDQLALAHNDLKSSEGENNAANIRCQMDPAFRKAFDFLKEGAITETPVETAFGYFIIKRGLP